MASANAMARIAISSKMKGLPLTGGAFHRLARMLLKSLKKERAIARKADSVRDAQMPAKIQFT
jgi:hypothetical protein